MRLTPDVCTSSSGFMSHTDDQLTSTVRLETAIRQSHHGYQTYHLAERFLASQRIERTRARFKRYIQPLFKGAHLTETGLQIPVIENLASHQGSYDTLNLTDNSLTTLGNIPLSTRLSVIHAANNQITSIAPSLPPNVRAHS